MDRPIVDVPSYLFRPTSIDIDIDWGGQSIGEGVDSSEQIVFNRLPRFTFRSDLVLDGDLIAEWRALRSRARGRAGAYRLQLFDPITQAVEYDVSVDYQRALRGDFSEWFPKVVCVGDVQAGSSQITIDEVNAPFPVRVGAWLSFNDWPFQVEDRIGHGANVTLSISRLHVGIPHGAQIDLIARGLFVSVDPKNGSAGYGFSQIARPQINMYEWITRS